MSTRPRVLIVTSRHLSYNPRVVREADVLASLDLDLQVLTQWDFPAYRTFDEALMTGRRWSVDGVSIEKRGSDFFRWWRTWRRQVRARNRWARGSVDVMTAGKAIGRTVPELATQGIAWQPTHVIAHHIDGLAAGALIAQNVGAQLFFDAEDDHLGELSHESPIEQHHLVQLIFDLCLPICRAWTASSESIAAEIARRHAIAPASAIFYNTTSMSEEAGTDWDGSSPLRLSWTSQTIGPKRGLSELVAALVGLDQPVKLALRGRDHLGFGAELSRLAGRRNLELEILPPLAPEALLADAARHHLGASVEVGPQPNYLHNAPNKLFHALGAGLGVVYTDTQGQREVMDNIPEAGLSLPHKHPDAWTPLLREWLQPETVNAARAAAREASRGPYSDVATRKKLCSLWRQLLDLE